MNILQPEKLQNHWEPASDRERDHLGHQRVGSGHGRAKPRFKLVANVQSNRAASTHV